MAPINKKLMLVFGAILVLALIIDWVPGLQFGGADETTATPIEAPPQAPVSPPPPAAPQPQVQSQPAALPVFSFTIDNINFKVAPFGGAYKSHLIYLPNGTVREVSPNANYTFTDTTKDGNRTSYSVFSLKLAKNVSPLRLNDNLTYYMMFTKDFNLAQNLKKLNNPELNRLVDLIGASSAAKEARKPVKIVSTPNSTVVLYDNYFGAPKDLYTVKKGATWGSLKSTRIDTSGFDDNGNSTEKKLEQQRQLIKQKTSYNCGTEAGALEFLNDLAYVPDLHGCPYESLN